MWPRGRQRRTVGRYEVIRPLARGGMAELYLGRARGIEGFEKLVVLKCIRQDYEHEGDFIRMFLDEARLAATLSHPNIAQVFDVDRSDGRYFFAMEYVDGRDLVAIRKAAAIEGGLALEHVLAIAVGVTAALHYAHELRDAEGRPRGVVHRDVSPSNVLVSHDGAVKLVDFGIARAAGRLTTTRAGTLKGKVRYMSPEQCAGQELDRRSDVYSLGAMLYELTTDHAPFTAEADVALAHRIATEDVPPPSSRVASYPPGLERIVLRALARDRDARYATAQALQLDLENLAVEQGLVLSPVGLAACMKRLFAVQVESLPGTATIPQPASRPTKPARPMRKRSRSRRWVLSGAMAVVALGAAGYAALPSSAPAPAAAVLVPAPTPPPAAPPPAAVVAPTAPPPPPPPPPAKPATTHSRNRHASAKKTPPRLPQGDDAPLP
jgi:eukaryotic-like serine/threonine-protein kinase